MAGTVLLGAMGIVAFLLLLLFFKLGQDEKKHYLFQILILSFVFVIIVLLGKTGLDYKDNCSWLVTNSTVSGSITSYQYGYQCSTNTSNSANIFYEVTVWIMRVTGIYMFLYFLYEILIYFGVFKSNEKQEGDGR